MAQYLYQEVMNVPGLNGTAGDRQRQLYERLGSPMGSYRGSYDQNIWLLNQIRSGNLSQSQQPSNTTPQAQNSQVVPTPSTITPFSQVLPYDKLFNPNLVTGLVEGFVAPDINRNRESGFQDLNSNLAATGRFRTGMANVDRENFGNQFSRQLQEQTAAGVGQFNNYLTDYYNNQSEQYYKNPSTYTQDTLPTFDSFASNNPGLSGQYGNQTNIPNSYQNYFKF